MIVKKLGVRLWSALALAVLVPACGTVGSGNGTLTPTISPAIPANVRALAGNRSVKITWESSVSGATFVVSRSLTSGGPYFPVSVPGGFLSPTTYEDSGLSNGTDYFYVVAAANSFGASAHSAESGATPGFKPISISARKGISYAILEDKSLWAWGTNSAGQLGNGLGTGISDVPTQVLGLDEVTAAAAGGYHGLALKSDGTVWSWGTEYYGATGNGISVNTITQPVQVKNLSGVVGVAAGDTHSFVLFSDGSAKGFGNNDYLQLGLGIGGGGGLIATPTPVYGLTGLTAIASGDHHTLFLHKDGTVWVAGSNVFGQLGLGTTDPIFNVGTPTRIPNLSGIIAVAAGSVHSMALREDGTVWAWGLNQEGELGTGSTSAPIPSPTAVAIKDVTAIAAGSRTGYALKSDGSVYAWGLNSSGGVGNGTVAFVNYPTPGPVKDVSPSVAIAAGFGHALALGANGTLRAWGDNGDGSLGNGTGFAHPLASPVLNLTDVNAIAAGQFHALTVRSDNTVWGWGTNSSFQLGTAPGTPVINPSQVAGIASASKVAAGGFHSLALKTDTSVWAWGNNTSGELGRGAASAASSTPMQVGVGTGVTAISAGEAFSLALKGDGTVWAWGKNDLGQLGRSPITWPTSGTPQLVLFPAPAPVIVAIAAGKSFGLAADNLGNVWAWGDNTAGQLGNGSVAPATPVSGSYVFTPAPVTGVSGISTVAAGNNFSLAMTTDKSAVLAWGSRAGGQLGDGTISSTPATSPVQVTSWGPGLSISAGYMNALGLKSDGTLCSWGDNFYGELGVGDFTNRATPTPIPGLSGILAAAAGIEFGVALLPDHTVVAWGLNTYGQMATPYVSSTGTPVSVTH